MSYQIINNYDLVCHF